MKNLISAFNNGVTELSNDLIIMIFLVLFTLIIAVMGVWIIAANINRAEKGSIGKMKVSGVVSIIIIVGIIVRILFSVATNGYLGTSPLSKLSFGEDGNLENSGGLIELYHTVSNIFKFGMGKGEINVYPVPLYLEIFFGGIANLFVSGPMDATNITPLMQIMFRLPFILCDAATAAVLYMIAKKYCNSHVGLGIAFIYMLCPLFFFVSGIWGSTFSILALFIVLSLYYMTQKNFFGLTISYSLALLTARDAMFFAPIFLIIAILYFARSLKANRNAPNKLSFKELFADKERGLFVRMPLYLIMSLLGMYIIQLPMLGYIDYNFFKWFAALFFHPFAEGMKYMSNNALAIYNIFGRNNALITGGIPTYVYSVMFGILATALVGVLYFSKKNRANMALIAAYILFTLGIFFMDFSELSFVPVLVTLLFAFIIIKDKRILHIFTLLSFAVILNASALMTTAGYFGNFEITEYVSGSGATATFSGNTFGTTFNVIATIIALLTFVYMTLIMLDISLTNQRKPFGVKSNSFGAAMSDWFALKG